MRDDLRAAEEDSSMLGKVTLSIDAGPLQGHEFMFEEHDTFLVGRTDDCHVKLPSDPFVSRHHFILEIEPPHARLRDLGSLNGTYVNGRLHGGRTGNKAGSEALEVDLSPGDHIQIGETVFSVGPSAQGTDRPSGSPKSGETTFLAPSPSDAKNPSIPGYEIVREIGAGGMGNVYRARSLQDGRKVAIKVMLAKVSVNEWARESFYRESELLRHLAHPQIASLIDAGSSGRLFYFVMDYYAGGNLNSLVKRTGACADANVAVPLILLALAGLEHAHNHRVVHRDIKPENILLELGANGMNARMADFGLAKSFAKAGLSGMTVTGMIGGTLQFMPLEQLTQFKYVQPASDVWSMAATLYFILTGQFVRDALPGQDPLQVVLESPNVPVQDRNPSVPREVAKVIDLALTQDLKERYPSAKEFREALLSAWKAVKKK